MKYQVNFETQNLNENGKAKRKAKYYEWQNENEK